MPSPADADVEDEGEGEASISAGELSSVIPQPAMSSARGSTTKAWSAGRRPDVMA
jgi:hypothetical protein